jgi:hypothetical protein
LLTGQFLTRFRWVACQLDYLCSLPNDAEKRKALGSLPPGLEATYERILKRVNQEDESIKTMVQNTLQWIVSADDEIPADALCHAISVKDGDKVLDQEALYDEEDILMYCKYCRGNPFLILSTLKISS